MERYVVVILWGLLSALSLLNLPLESDLTAWQKIAVVGIVIVGGPIFAANEILTELLDYIGVGGDNSDDEENLHKGY